MHPHLIGNDENIREEDRRIDTDDIDWLKSNFTSLFRVVAEIEEVTCLFSDCHIFRQVSSCLSHHPDRCIGCLFAQAGIYKNLTHQWSPPL